MTDQEFEQLNNHLLYAQKTIKRNDIFYFFHTEADNADFYRDRLLEIADDRNIFRITDYCKSHNLTMIVLVFRHKLFSGPVRNLKAEENINRFIASAGCLVPEEVALSLGDYVKRCLEMYDEFCGDEDINDAN